MGLTPADRVHSTSGLQVRLVALEGGQHATLILEHGRISKLVSPEGEVAVPQWQRKDADAATSTSTEAQGRAEQAYSSAGPFWASMHGGRPSPRSPAVSTTDDVADKEVQDHVSDTQPHTSSGGCPAASQEPTQWAAPQQRSGLEGKEAAAAGVARQVVVGEPDQANSDRLLRLLGEAPTVDFRQLRAELQCAPHVLGARSGGAIGSPVHRRTIRAAAARDDALKLCSAQLVQQQMAARAPERASARDGGDLAHSQEGAGPPAPVVCAAAAAQASCSVREPEASARRETGSGSDLLDRVSECTPGGAVQQCEARSRCYVPVPRLNPSATSAFTAECQPHECQPRLTTSKGGPRRSKVWSTLTSFLHKGQVHQSATAAKSGGSCTLPRRVCAAPSSTTREQVVEVQSGQKPDPTPASVNTIAEAPIARAESDETVCAKPAPTATQPAGHLHMAAVNVATPDSVCTAPTTVLVNPGTCSSTAVLPWTGMAGRWRLEPDEAAEDGASAVEALLDAPLLQRLARKATHCMHILETEDALEVVQDIALRGGARIRRSTVYSKSTAVVQEARCDGRDGLLRSQLNVSPQGHCYIRSLQGEPGAAVFHRRMKMSMGGHRLKVEHKFQLLSAGVSPIVYHMIWHRVSPAPELRAAVLDGNAPECCHLP